MIWIVNGRTLLNKLGLNCSLQMRERNVHEVFFLNRDVQRLEVSQGNKFKHLIGFFELGLL